MTRTYEAHPAGGMVAEDKAEADRMARKLVCSEPDCTGTVMPDHRGGLWRVFCVVSKGRHTLRRMETPGEHYRRTGEGDAVTQMVEERRILQTMGTQQRDLDIIREEARPLAPLQPLDVADIQRRFDAIEFIKSKMVDGKHYGLIPGTGNKSLWLPGAELIRMALVIPVSELSPPEIEIDERKEFIKATYHLGCVDPSGNIHADARRTASSDEKRFQPSERTGRGGFTWPEMRDIVPQRAWKRTFVQIINVMSGLSGEFKESAYEEPENGERQQKRTPAKGQPTPPKREGAPIVAPPQKGDAPTRDSVPKNLNELWALALADPYNLDRNEVMKIAGVTSPQQIADVSEVWEKIKATKEPQ